MKKPKQSYPIDATVQRRLDALEWLIDRQYNQSVKLFQVRTGITMAQVNQWFSGYRALRDKALKRLEEKTGKPAGWFDVVHGAIEVQIPMVQAGGDDRPQNSLTEHLVALELSVHGLAPELRTAGRDALRKWANKDASASETAGTLEALAKATSAMATQKKPNGSAGPIKKAA